MPTIGRDVDCFSARFEVKSEVEEVLLHLIDELMTIIAGSSRKCASVGEVLRTFHRYMQSSGRKCFALNTFSREMNHDLSPRKWKPDRRGGQIMFVQSHNFATVFRVNNIPHQ